MHAPTSGQIALILLSIAFYIAGGAISLTRIKSERPWSRLSAKICLYFGMLSAFAVLVWHSFVRRNWLPLEDNFDTLIWLALVLTMFVMYVQRRKPLGGLDWFVMPIVILLLVGAAIAGTAIPHNYEAKGLWLWFHLATTFGGVVAFAIAAAGGAMYLIVNYRLRHKLLSGPNFGSLERLEHLTMTAVTLGFALLTVGAVTGFIKMKSDPNGHIPAIKLVMSIAVWMVYAVVLHAPLNPSFRGRRVAILSVVGFVLMGGTVVAAMLIKSGA